jgi:hypothetical protein
MRVSRAGLIGVAAAALAGLLAALAASAAGFTISQPTTTSTQGFSTTTTSTTVATTQTPEQINAALAALAGGQKTLGGPGAFLAGPNGETRIYEVLAPLPPPVCVTVRNLSNGEIRVSPSSSSSIDVLPLETRSVCVPAPMAIQLTCRQGTVCEAVWRVDRT